MIRFRCLAALVTVLVVGCVSPYGTTSGHRLDFDKPPTAGSRVAAGQSVFACTSRDGARFMTLTGFLHAHCSQIVTVNDTRIAEREYEDLGEGGMWLLRLAADDDDTPVWFVLPWHDWI